jgi:hypothetical protein
LVDRPSIEGELWFCVMEYTARPPPPAHAVQDDQPDIWSTLRNVTAVEGTVMEAAKPVKTSPKVATRKRIRVLSIG